MLQEEKVPPNGMEWNWEVFGFYESIRNGEDIVSRMPPQMHSPHDFLKVNHSKFIPKIL